MSVKNLLCRLIASFAYGAALFRRPSPNLALTAAGPALLKPKQPPMSISSRARGTRAAGRGDPLPSSMT